MQIQTAQGANLTLTVDTSSLVGRTGGPFSVGFYVNDGSKLGDGNNTVTLTGFDFGGGNALGNITQLGTASGSLSSSITLTDSLLITGFTQQFNPGSHLAFTISTTTNIDSGGVPDMFVMVILDGNAKPLPTQTGQTLFPVLAAMTINSAAPSVQTYGLVSALLATATPLGSMAQIASAGGWNTTFALVNTGQTPAAAQLNFYSDPTGTPLPFPLTFPQIPLNSLTSASFDRMINPNSVFMVNTSGSVSQAATIGWGELLASSSAVSGFGVFNFPQLNWNAVVPLETRNANSYILPFDNTGSLATGVAVANVAAEAANIPVIIRSDTGAQIGTATVALTANGHASFMLNQQYPVTTGLRGSVEFDAPAGGQISVLGVRANGPALTTLPVLANVGTSGGAIAHSTYNGGFTSSFYLVNVGTTASPFTISFFDENGNPQQVPLSLPQSQTTTTAAVLTQTLAAGAVLEIDTQAQDSLPLVQGSAQLTTTGNISGYEVFRWTTYGQEASVPLETRAPNSFVLIFDNTNGLTTGLALANVADQNALVTINMRDDTGALLQTTVTSVAAFGHTSFMLPDVYPMTVGERGTVEFVPPTGGRISVIGVRATSDGTLTTIPVLAK